MNESRRKALSVRLPLVAAILTASFWGIWSAICGSVPMIKIGAAGETILTTTSRWTDVIFCPLLVFFLTITFTNTNQEVMKEKHLFRGMGYGLGVALGLAIMTIGESLPYWFVAMILSATILGLFVSSRGPVWMLSQTSIFASGVLLGIWFSYGLVYGLLLGLSYGLACGLISGFFFGVGALIRYLCSETFRQRIWRWVTASDKE